jgi:hypothetical protein
MAEVTLNQYDAGNAGGDNNLTQKTQYVDGSTTRVTSFLYDWRDRQTDVDGEVDFYAKTYYDNLDRVIKNERYNTSLSGNLVARSLTFYDDRSRVFQTVRYAVDITTGIVGNSLVDNTWFDSQRHWSRRPWHSVECSALGSRHLCCSLSRFVGSQPGNR